MVTGIWYSTAYERIKERAIRDPVTGELLIDNKEVRRVLGISCKVDRKIQAMVIRELETSGYLHRKDKQRIVLRG